MSKIVRIIENRINGLPQKFYLSKIRYGEKIAIRRKKQIFEEIKWSDEKRKQFDAFWLSSYGKKIKPYWHKLYESANGVYHFDYFPENLYSTELEPLLNPTEYCRVFSDKNLTEAIYGSVEEVHFPVTILANCNGCFSDGKGRTLSSGEATDLLQNIGKCVIKPSVDSGSGKGVMFAEFCKGIDINSDKTVESIFSKYKKDFVVQKILKNAKTLFDIYPNSLNTFRVITYIVDGKVCSAPVSLRIGAGDNKVDNIHKGGLVAGVNGDGTLKKYAYQLGYGDSKTRFTAHPDTGMVFEKYYVGDVRKMISTAEKLHAVTPQLGIISWDMTFDENDNVVLIEANCREQSVWFPQIVNECPLFGDNTEYMINLIRR